VTTWRDFSKRKGERIALETSSALLQTQTRYQQLEIRDTVSYGRALFLDDKIQSAEQDEFIYHESLVHPALVCHPAPRRVFIAGGGEGATLREVLRHGTVEHVVMCDLDEQVVNAARRYLPTWSAGAYDDPRVTLVHADARAFLAAESAPCDAIIVDVTDPLAGGPSCRIFTREFYALAHERLVPGGTIAVQAESTDLGVLEGHLAIVRTLGAVFPVALGYHTHVPSFGESWGFAIGCKAGLSGVVDPSGLGVEHVDRVLAARGCTNLRFYDGLTHRRLFSPPKHERALASLPGPIITDDNPLIVE
jgi:spermidine synthase